MSEGSDQFVVDNKPSESENTIPPFYRNPVQEPFGSDGRPFYQNNRQGFGYRRDGFQNRGRGFNRGNFRGNNHNNRWQNRNQGDHNQHRGEGRRQNHNANRNIDKNIDISAYFHPSMLEDPWAEFQEDNSEQTESRSEEIAIEEETCT